MSKILLYSENSTGVTTNETQYAFYINENGLPTVKNGSETITFGTSGFAFAGSSGSSGANGTIGTSGSSGLSGTSGQDGATGETGSPGVNGTSGVSGTSGINGVDGASGSSGAAGTSGSSGETFGTSGTSGATGATGTSGSSGVSGTNGLTAVGAASKGGSVAITSFTGDTLVYNVVFASNFANTNYSVSVEYTGDEAPNASGLDPWITNKTVSGFTINTGFGSPIDPSLDTIVVDWLAISQGETGVAGAPGSSGTSGATGSSGSSGAAGATGSSGSSGANGSSGTSAAGGGGGGPSLSEELLNVQLLSGTTVNGDNEYLYGFFGNTSHWGFGGFKNYWFGQTYPCTIPEGKQLATVYFPIEVDNAEKPVQYHIVVWKNTPGSFYPSDRVNLDSFTLSGLTTGYNVIEYDVNFLNDGSYGDDTLFFVTIARYDPDGDAQRFRKSVAFYFDIDKMGVFNHTTKNFMVGQGQGMITTIFNPDWSTVPSTYTGGTISFGIANDECIPFFWNLA